MVGGAAGTLARAALAAAWPVTPGSWPWATLIANVAGTLILAGVSARLAEGRARSSLWRLLLGTGFCGALTTFSTLQVELLQLALDGHAITALAYATVSLTLGMACAGAVAWRARSRA